MHILLMCFGIDTLFYNFSFLIYIIYICTYFYNNCVNAQELNTNNQSDNGSHLTIKNILVVKYI